MGNTITRIASQNNIVLTGAVGDDKNIFKNEKGNFASFRFAHNIGKDENKKTVWVKVKAFSTDKNPIDLALIAKGAKLKIEGRFSLDEFERKDGTPGSELVIVARSIEANTPAEVTAADDGNESDIAMSDLEF